nr:hypothetical protein [Tatlockia sp.]
MLTKGFFSQKSLSIGVDLPNSQENSQLLVNPSIQEDQKLSQVVISSEVKQFIKGFLEQARGAVLGGAVIVNYVELALVLMGHKFTINDHRRLETLLFTLWGLRGGAAVVLALTGLKNKAPDATAAYILTEKNVIRMLVNASFLHKMPITFSINSSLQIASSIMVVVDHALSAKALAENQPDPGNFSYPEIKNKYQGQSALIALVTLIEMLFRAIQLGATTYTAGNAIADAFIDAVSPQDPKNQQQILMILALAMSIVGALSVLHPVLNEIATLIRY